MKRFFLLLAPGLLLTFLSLLGGLAGYRINLTPSMPLGFWKESTAIKRGSYVAACMPVDTEAARLALQREYVPAGWCSGGFAPLLKQIVALPGDTVTLTNEAVLINEACLPNSRTLSSDSSGRPLPSFPRGTYRVPQGEYWLFAVDLQQSFDSRYFGPVPESSIVSSLVPVMTAESKRAEEW